MKKRLVFALMCMPAFIFAKSFPLPTTTQERSALSATAVGSYLGQGDWKTSEGDAGTYYVKTVVVSLSGIAGMNIQNSFLDPATNRTWNFDYTVQREENGFAKIWVDGAIAGSGYCFPLRGPSDSSNDKKCHMDIIVNGLALEQTAVMKGQNIYIFGSHAMADGQGIVAWEQKLDMVIPAP